MFIFDTNIPQVQFIFAVNADFSIICIDALDIAGKFLVHVAFIAQFNAYRIADFDFVIYFQGLIDEGSRQRDDGGVAQLLDRPFDANGSECVHPVFANGDIVLHEIGHLTNRLKSSSLYAVMLNCWFWRPLVWANSNFSMAM